ncbi:MAG TPA: hypothetical protein PLM29_13070, partial [Deltaproteobacteria bacterium]|nr:hypothetical protein [Deltaproteobacteria bacterium]
MRRNILGIDVGSVAIGVCEVTPERKIHRSAYRFHRGKIAETLLAILVDFDMAGISTVAASTSTPDVIRAEKRYDNHVALIASVKHLHENARCVLNVGGERFSLIEFDEDGNYLNCRSNTSCAAGTGSFLDQQALRL